MSIREFWNYQASTFNSIYRFAKHQVPYYQSRFNEYPETLPKEDAVLERLTHLPILKKQAVRQYNSDLYPSSRSWTTTFHSTSGTTGTPVKLASNLQEKGLHQALLESWYLRLCGTRYPRTLYLTGFMTPSPGSQELFWHDRVTGNTYLSIYSLKPQNRDTIAHLVQQLRPQLLFGYASAVHQFAVLMGDRLQETRHERIALVTSEVLQPEWRADIETICAQVFDFYSSLEGCHAVMQCAGGSMHINPLAGIVEIVDEAGHPVQEGELGQVLVTGLIRKSMPLIRYEIGDYAVSTGYASDCPCGLQWPTIAQVEGRLENLIKTRDGRRIGLLGAWVLDKLQGVKESQLIQVGYEDFVCNLVKDEHHPVDDQVLETIVQSELQKYLQTSVHVRLHHHASIPRGPRGKFSTVVVNF